MLNILDAEALIITSDEVVRLCPLTELSQVLELGSIVLIVMEFLIETSHSVAYNNGIRGILMIVPASACPFIDLVTRNFLSIASSIFSK